MYDDLLKDLLQSRARAWGELQHFVKEARETRSFGDPTKETAEDKQEWDRRTADLDDFDRRIKDIKTRVESDKQADEMRASSEALIRPQHQPDGETDWAEQEKRTLAFFSADLDEIKSGRNNSLDISLRGLGIERVNDRNIVRETRSLRPIGAAIETRTGLNVGTGTAGGDLFNTSFRALLYQHLIFNSAIRQTRATVLTTGGGEPLLLPKTTAHPTSAGTITPEAVTINESDPTFDQGTLNSYKYSNLVLVSSELEQDTQVDLLGYLAMAMGRALGNSSGVDFVTGTGSSKPNGVIHAAGTIAQVTGGTPAASGATFAELTQLYDKIIPAYQVSAEWFMGQSAMQKVRALTNSQGTPIFLPSLYGSSPDTLFGKPIVLDPNVPTPASNATSIAFGDFASYFIRDVAGLRFERSIDFKFDTDQIAYRAILRTDGDLLDLTGAIGVYKGGTA
jgi:HK97 family phage major capsid protein